MSLWYVFGRTSKAGKKLLEYTLLGTEPERPSPGVGLWPTRPACKAASKYLADHPRHVAEWEKAAAWPARKFGMREP